MLSSSGHWSVPSTESAEARKIVTKLEKAGEDVENKPDEFTYEIITAFDLIAL